MTKHTNYGIVKLSVGDTTINENTKDITVKWF